MPKTKILAALLVFTSAQASAQRINTIKPTAPTPAGAVTLQGTVVDADGRPLAAAEIIVDSDHRAISNAVGEFRIQGLEPGTLEFTARRIGYTPVVKGIQVDPGVTAQLAVSLVPVAVELGTVVVEGKRLDKTLWQSGFYDRQTKGMGTYFDANYLSHFHASIANLVSMAPSVRVERTSNGRAIAVGKLPNGGTCPLSVFLDGNFVPWAIETGLDDVINPEEVLAVEIYSRASEIPATIAGKGGMSGVGAMSTIRSQAAGAGQAYGECGAILMWTKPLRKK
jgi:hypothetical protein